MSEMQFAAMDAVLGSMLIEPKCVGGCMAELLPQHFTEPVRKLVFSTMQALFQEGKPVDAVTVASKLQAIDDKYANFIADLIDITPTAANVGEYVRIVKRQALQNRLQGIGMKMQAAETADEAIELMAQANTILAERASKRRASMSDLLTNFFERHKAENKAEYLSWGIAEFDKIIFAEAGDLVIIGGYPSDGKTSLALRFALHQAEKKRVGFYSYETGKDKLFDRAAAMAAQIKLPNIKNNALSDDEWTTMAEMSGHLIGLKLEVIEASGMTVAQIRADALANNYDVIYIDYLQKIAGGSQRMTDFERVSQISSDLQSFGRQSRIPIVALSQLSRPEKGTSGKVPPPSLSSLRQSGQIEQDADVVFLLYREEPKNSKSRRVLNVAKNKEGETNVGMFLDFDGETQTFRKSTSQEPRQQAKKPEAPPPPTMPPDELPQLSMNCRVPFEDPHF